MDTAVFMDVDVLSALNGRLDRSRLYDLTMRVPVIAYSLFVLGRDVCGFYEQVATQQAMFRELDAGVAVAALARASQWIFIALLAILPVFRLPPIGKSDRIWPRFVALAAVGLIPLFTLLDRAPASLSFNSAAVLLGLTANVMAIVTVSFLGRSLSVMPEARRLVTSGPYAVVRHPLYLCEMLGVIAMVLQYRSITAIGLFAVIIAVQASRACVEEAVLARAFPDFSSYCTGTPFFLPHDPTKLVTIFFIDPIAQRRSALVMGSVVTVSVLAVIGLPLLAR